MAARPRRWAPASNITSTNRTSRCRRAACTDPWRPAFPDSLPRWSIWPVNMANCRSPPAWPAPSAMRARASKWTTTSPKISPATGAASMTVHARRLPSTANRPKPAPCLSNRIWPRCSPPCAATARQRSTAATLPSAWWPGCGPPAVIGTPPTCGPTRWSSARRWSPIFVTRASSAPRRRPRGRRAGDHSRSAGSTQCHAAAG